MLHQVLITWSGAPEGENTGRGNRSPQIWVERYKKPTFDRKVTSFWITKSTWNYDVISKHKLCCTLCAVLDFKLMDIFFIDILHPATAETQVFASQNRGAELIAGCFKVKSLFGWLQNYFWSKYTNSRVSVHYWVISVMQSGGKSGVLKLIMSPLKTIITEGLRVKIRVSATLSELLFEGYVKTNFCTFGISTL